MDGFVIGFLVYTASVILCPCIATAKGRSPWSALGLALIFGCIPLIYYIAVPELKTK